jgi:hypothetical protein
VINDPLSLAWDGYGVVVLPAGRPAVFEGMTSDRSDAERYARDLWTSHRQDLRAVDVDRWRSGRIVATILHLTHDSDS